MIRNRELRPLFACLALAGVSGSAVCFFMAPAAGAAALAFHALSWAFYVFYTRRRYRSLARMSEGIDLALHGAAILSPATSSEGELSILQSEISKLIARVKEQNEELSKDRQRIADYTADIAHQLRTPLTAAGLIIPLLASNPDPKERHARARELEGLLLRTDWLLGALLKTARIDAGAVEFQRSPVSVARLVESALRPLAGAMDLRGVGVEVTVPEDAVIEGDFGWLSEAVQNLLKNCVENSPENGTVTVSCVSGAFFTEMTVRDCGPGFDREDIARLFERFYRGRGASTPGSGVGLSLSRMIITRQGGSVGARNRPGGGAEFTVRFPK